MHVHILYIVIVPFLEFPISTLKKNRLLLFDYFRLYQYACIGGHCNL